MRKNKTIIITEEQFRHFFGNRLLSEVRYIDTDYTSKKSYNSIQQEPIKNNESIRVFHGFNSIEDAILIARYGTSGKQRVPRKFSYESGMNPNGLFVTTDFNIASKDFSYGNIAVVMEFSVKASDLDTPVWNNNSSYFGQNSNPRPFKNRDEREAQKTQYQKDASKSEYDYVRNSDNPAMAQNIFHNNEHQALFVGDLNPNMIKRFWVLDTRKDSRWRKYSVQDFLKLYGNTEIQQNKYQFHHFPDDKLYMPNEDFQGWNDFWQRYASEINSSPLRKKNPKTIEDIKKSNFWLFDKPNYHFLDSIFWPKQLIQIYGVEWYREHFNPLSTI